MNFTATVGEENNTMSTVKLSVFLCYSPDRDLIGKPLGMAPGRISNRNSFQAVRGKTNEIGGRWVTYLADIQEGEILDLFANIRLGRRVMPVMAHALLLFREDAPLQRVRVSKLIKSGDSTLTYADYTGNFDLISFVEAKAIGAKLNNNFRSLFDEERENPSVFIPTVLVEGKAPSQTEIVEVETSTGIVEIVRNRRRRRFNDI